MSLRGYELVNIEVIPFEYNFESKQLKVYTDLDIIIHETTDRISDNSTPRSIIFDN